MTLTRRDFLRAAVVAPVVPALVNVAPAKEPEAWIREAPGPRDIFTTGLTALDAALGGGLRSGTLGLVLGRPWSGRSTFLRTAFIRNVEKCGAPLGWSRGLGSSDRLFLSADEMFLDLDDEIGTHPRDYKWLRAQAEIGRACILLGLPANQIGMRMNDRGGVWSDKESFGLFRNFDYIFPMGKKKIYIMKSRWSKPDIPRTIRFNYAVEGKKFPYTVLTDGNSMSTRRTS